MFRFKLPFRMIISGSSGVGKSTRLANIIKNRDQIIDGKLEKVIYCAKFLSSMPESIHSEEIVSFYPDLQTSEMFQNADGKNLLIVIDDLMDSAMSSEIVSDIFTQGRNRNVSVILLSQNLFQQGSKSRSISLNSNFMIIFKNVRDSSSIIHLAKQICPGHSKDFSNMFINNVNQPFSYLLLDFTPTTADVFRFRENIFSDCPSVFAETLKTNSGPWA